MMNHRNQKGAVLIVGLLILLLTTLVALGSMQNSNLQEKMATNAQESNRAFQAAESASDEFLTNAFDDGNKTFLTLAINEYLKDGSNWPTTNVSSHDNDITSNLEFKMVSDRATFSCNSRSLNSDENKPSIDCYSMEMKSAATISGSKANVSIVQGFILQ